ncbi:ATP-binding protein [Spongisporangium articulatum]|uniref:Sensor-like histidine kinase SenX3 n=1 Tax=Spongisporangium articulatum TaxID=3362603 RepID=A0ABW8AKQ5_9ACTN
MQSEPSVVLLVHDDLVAKQIDLALQRAVPDVVIRRPAVVGSSTVLAQQVFAGADLVVCDGVQPGSEGLRAFHQARLVAPSVACALVVDPTRPHEPGEDDVAGLEAIGVTPVGGAPDQIGDQVADLIVTQGRRTADQEAALRVTGRRSSAAAQAAGYELLVGVVQQLSLAPDIASIMAVVRGAARQLSGADGATFVLRDRGFCYYADEDAIGPLWKGQRFPMEACVSGWAMTHRQPAVLPDIHVDARIPRATYEPTFVRSMVMVPIRAVDPIGAIGTYWSQPREFDADLVRLLQALADSTAVAIENVRVQNDLERRVAERTEELEAFTYAVSHDLRAPIRHLSGYAAIGLDGIEKALAAGDPEQLAEVARTALDRVGNSAASMRDMVNGLLELSRVTRAEVRHVRVDLAELARDVAAECSMDGDTGRRVEFVAPEHAWVLGDPALLRLVLQNLLGNAWKFTAQVPRPRVEFGVEPEADPLAHPPRFYVQDNGVGFDERYAGKLFGVFQRLHEQSSFPGTGVGLASVRRIVQRHGGGVEASGKPGEGARFAFTLQPDLEHQLTS